MLFTAPVKASASDGSAAYGYTIESFQTEIVVNEDSTIEVEEILTVSFSGFNSHGIIRDFPLGGGVRYTDFSAECTETDFSPYFKTDEVGVLSWYLRGDGLVRGKTVSYLLSYTVHGFETDGVFPIDLYGFDMGRTEYFYGRVVLPEEGFLSYTVYSGEKGTTVNALGVEPTVEGNVITVEQADGISGGITLDLTFEKGTLHTSTDMGLLYALLVAAFTLALAVLCKLVFCYNKPLVRTVNFTAPDDIDPLLAGVLIDNKADDGDLSALVFHLAAKGYLTIDFTDEKDPLLTKTQQSPDGLTRHERIFYDGLFRHGESVRLSALAYTFYSTAESAKSAASIAAGKRFTGRGKTFFVLLAVLSLLSVGGFFWLYGTFAVGAYNYWLGFPLAFFSFLIPAFIAGYAEEHKFKWGAARFFCPAGGFLLGAAVGAVGFLFPPAYTASYTLFLSCAALSLAGLFGGSCRVRTDDYNDRLGRLLGFRDFILYTEKDKIAAMLQTDPELYYKVLPYAQVLGVSDAWEEKFAALTLQPPAYFYSATPVLFRVALFNTFTRGFRSVALASPSTQGKGGFGGGSFGGGSGGGGFGGGGVRGC